MPKQLKVLKWISKFAKPKPPLCKGRWADARRLGGIVQENVTNSLFLQAKWQEIAATIPQSRLRP